MEMIKQKTGDDCGVASVAMIYGLPYDTVLEAAKKIGYRPGSGKGVYPAELLEELGKDFHIYVERIVIRPCLVSVASINQPGRHLVVLTEDDQVLDPSPNKEVSVHHVYKTVSFSYAPVKSYEGKIV